MHSYSHYSDLETDQNFPGKVGGGGFKMGSFDLSLISDHNILLFSILYMCIQERGSLILIAPLEPEESTAEKVNLSLPRLEVGNPKGYSAVPLPCSYFAGH